MPLPFGLPQRPSLPSLTWGYSPKPDETSPVTPTPNSAPIQNSQPSNTDNPSKTASKRFSGRSLRHTSLFVSRPTTPAKTSPLTATFGLPVEDDDPFGVLALEQAGLQIKEAGTHANHRPGSDAFQYRPSPNSPIWRSSMASAMSKNSRPSLDGRASIATGRPSFAHSRQSSLSEVVAQISQDSEAHSGGESSALSQRGISPIREASPLRQTSPDKYKGKTAGSRKSKLGGSGERPPPLKLVQVGQRHRNDDLSPKTRLSAVQEKVREIEREQKAREAKASQERKTSPPPESDLDRLAREIKEMAHEHDEEIRKSEEAERNSEEESRKSNEQPRDSNQTRSVDEGLRKDEPIKVVGSEEAANGGETVDKLTAVSRAQSKRASKTKSRIVSDKTAVAVLQDDDEGELEEEEEEDDDEDEDYDSFDDEEPIIIEAAVQTPVTARPRNLGVQSLQARAQVVSIHMPPPPAIPSRNPRRSHNSTIFEEGSSTPTSPLPPQDGNFSQSGTSVSDSETSGDTSKAASIRSAQDNDTNSTYSLERERDSFSEVNHDVMSQTSHGSDDNHTLDLTPTKMTMDESAIEEDETQSPLKTPRESTTDRLQKGIAIHNAAHETIESDQKATTEQHVSNDEVKSHATESTQETEKEAAVPVVPERRRPFSFEASSSDEPISTISIATALDPGNTAKVEIADRPDDDTPVVSVQPIVIPNLPDDDESEYEEDFS